MSLTKFHSQLYESVLKTLQIWNGTRIAVTTWLTGKTNQSYHQWFGKASGQNAWTTDTFHIHADVEGRRPSCMYGRSSSNLRHCCCRFSFHASVIAIYDVYFPIWIDFNSIMLLLCAAVRCHIFPSDFYLEASQMLQQQVWSSSSSLYKNLAALKMTYNSSNNQCFQLFLSLSWKLYNLGHWKVSILLGN